MLTCSSLNAGTSDRKAVHFRVIKRDTVVLAVLFYIAVSCLVGNGRDSPRLENV